uniref:Uncharacterized protein n=1 Tax=Solanum lycopersicum TaxID=4081 RepID=A0A3Q7H4K6_SOLLC
MKNHTFLGLLAKIKFIMVACYWDLQVSSRRCTTALAWHTPPILVDFCVVIKTSTFLEQNRYNMVEKAMDLAKLALSG